MRQSSSTVVSAIPAIHARPSATAGSSLTPPDTEDLRWRRAPLLVLNRPQMPRGRLVVLGDDLVHPCEQGSNLIRGERLPAFHCESHRDPGLIRMLQGHAFKVPVVGH